MKPLAGTTVVDVTHLMAGPQTSYQLALLGAEVIKVEAPGKGDEFRNYYGPYENTNMCAAFMAVNAGKKSLTLNLKSEKGQEILRELIRKGDVLVQNYRLETARRMGIGPETCEELNPNLVYCAISGFGSEGPMSDYPAYDPTIQAMSGLMTMRGPDQPPWAIPFIIIDTITGFNAAYAILAALLQRYKTGKGQRIDVSMLDAAVRLLMSPLHRYLITGELLKDRGNRAGRDNVGALLLKAGKGYIWVAANYQNQFEAFCRTIKGESILEDERFAVHEARVKHVDELEKVLESYLAARSAIEWEAELNKAGCPAGAVRTLDEVAQLPVLRDRGLLIEGGVTGIERPIPFVNAGFQFEHDGPGIDRPVPSLGQHTEEVLGQLGYNAAAVESLRREGVV